MRNPFHCLARYTPNPNFLDCQCPSKQKALQATINPYVDTTLRYVASVRYIKRMSDQVNGTCGRKRGSKQAQKGR